MCGGPGPCPDGRRGDPREHRDPWSAWGGKPLQASLPGGDRANHVRNTVTGVTETIDEVPERHLGSRTSRCTMNLWLPLCLVVAASFVGIWCPVHAQGVSEDCCLAYHRLESLDFLKRALGYQRQEVSGSCNLPAVIFFLRKHRMVCGNPRDKRVKYWTEFLDARKAKHHRSRLRTPSGVSWPPRSNKTKTALRTTAHPDP
uniref:Chemokine interleukin-8-like domain-containing protein n=1 Tax=Felis catus TaxID=9685 RepID=A0ABI8AGE0_FELCA